MTRHLPSVAIAVAYALLGVGCAIDTVPLPDNNPGPVPGAGGSGAGGSGAGGSGFIPPDDTDPGAGGSGGSGGAGGFGGIAGTGGTGSGGSSGGDPGPSGGDTLPAHGRGDTRGDYATPGETGPGDYPPGDDNQGDPPPGDNNQGDPPGDLTPPIPVITAVEGDSVNEDSAGRLRVRTGVSIRGSGLTGPTVTLLPDGGTAEVLTIRSESDTEVVVDLPPSTAPGSYTLTLTNIGGSDQATVILMQGAPGSTAGCP